MENKISIEKKISHKIVKIRGQKVCIKPYISTKELVVISDICLQQFDSFGEDLENLGFIKTIFDMLAIHTCTNIKVNGVKTDSSKQDFGIQIDLKSREIEDFEEKLLIYDIKPYILNYEECYNSVLKSFELKNILNAFSVLSRNIPSMEEMGSGIKAAVESIRELKEKDPSTFNKVVKESIEKSARENGIKEFKKSKKVINKKG